MGKKQTTGMDELLEAVGAAINSAAPSSRDALAKTMAAYRKESPDDYLWATGPQVPALLNRLMMAVTPEELAQSKQTRNSTSVRDFLYKACLSGQWPFRCIEGFENWETGPIRFFYDDFRSEFHEWRKRSGDGGHKTNFLKDKIEEVHPTCTTHLRSRVPEGSGVARSPSDGRARAVELPSLIDCRKDFDRLFKNPQDWAPPQSKKNRNHLQAWLQRATPMRQWLYNVCLDGVWPVKCIEGYENWDVEAIRFFYEDLKNEFHAWCKHTGIAPDGMGQAHMSEIFPKIKTQLRLRGARRVTCRAHRIRW